WEPANVLGGPARQRDRAAVAAPIILVPTYLAGRQATGPRDEGPSHNFYVYDFARGVLTKMSFDGLSHAPVWSPDGKQLAFRSWKLGGMTMWSMPADRSGSEQRLYDQKGMQSVVSWSPDGAHIAYVDFFL